jgi:transposase
MTKAYSQDLRDRVIAAVEQDGLSRREAARRYRIGDATAVRWLAALSEGRRGPRAQGGDRRSRLPAYEAWLLALIKVEADLTLAAIADRLLAEHGVKADADMLSRFFTGRGIRFKKCMVRPRLASVRCGRRNSLRKCIRPVCGTSRSLAMMGYASRSAFQAGPAFDGCIFGQASIVSPSTVCHHFSRCRPLRAGAWLRQRSAWVADTLPAGPAPPN